jgi:hypothetical protein
MLVTAFWTSFAVTHVNSFSAGAPNFSNKSERPDTIGTKENNILILDHLKINHEQGRHDWLKAFYFDFLQCVVDPRKQKKIDVGKKTVWANIGANQFHLPEGKPDAQVLEGVVTLVYPCLEDCRGSVGLVKEQLRGSQFQVNQVEEALHVSDPWGNQFRLV